MRVLYPRNLRVTIAAALVLGATAFSPQHSRGEPTGTIRMIVPLPPGGPADTLARLVAEQISLAHGPTIVVENRPGASTVTGTEAASHAAPDGNTLLMTAPAFLTTAHLRKVNYDPLSSFEPLCNLASSPLLIVVNSGSPYRTLGDLLAAARARPGELTLAGTGPGSSTQVGFELLKRAANVNMTFVPYAGDAPAVSALLGGHVASAWVNYQVAAEQVQSGRLRALATPSRARSDMLQDVPTVGESGFKDVEIEFWNGVLVPANTPSEKVSQLVAMFSTAVHAPELEKRLRARGFLPVGACGADFRALLSKQFYDFGRIIREAHISAE
jgi:tripartite-type tricarboxylate transporter receptor subunit TctC